MVYMYVCVCMYVIPACVIYGHLNLTCVGVSVHVFVCFYTWFMRIQLVML